MIQLLFARVDLHQAEVAIRLRNDGLSSLASELGSISATERIAVLKPTPPSWSASPCRSASAEAGGWSSPPLAGNRSRQPIPQVNNPMIKAIAGGREPDGELSPSEFTCDRY